MQQINLYLPEFQPNRKPLRSIHMLWGVLVFVCALAAVSVTSLSTNHKRAAELEKNRQQFEQRKLQLAQLEQQRPQVNLAALDEEIVHLQQELRRREHIMAVISHKKLCNNTGYSAYLRALRTESLDTISLQAFSLQQGGNYVEFAGQTRAADQVPLYIQRLRSQAAFAQSAFGVLHLKPAAQGTTNLFDFVLAKASDNAAPAGKTALQQLQEANKNSALGSRGGQP